MKSRASVGEPGSPPETPPTFRSSKANPRRRSIVWSMSQAFLYDIFISAAALCRGPRGLDPLEQPVRSLSKGLAVTIEPHLVRDLESVHRHMPIVTNDLYRCQGSRATGPPVGSPGAGYLGKADFFAPFLCLSAHLVIC